jgi:Uncharacterized conserved protein (DUF2163)
MKKFISGAGVDTTSAVSAWLKSHSQIWIADLYLIGEPDDPQAAWLTNWESPLQWSWWGSFLSTVIKRGSIRTVIGLEADSVEVSWSPLNRAISASMATASYYQLARLGWFNQKRLRIWRTIMPTPGDADTFGAAEWFAGIIGDVSPEPGKITLSVNSLLYVLNQKVPSGVIEGTNTLASYSGGTPMTGDSVLPQFSIVAGSNANVLLCDQISPHAGAIPGTNSLAGGYVYFVGGSGATLKGQYSVIGANDNYDAGGGVHHTRIQLYSPLPWAPTPGVDTFFVSKESPVTDPSGGFPYVPSPETAV